MPEGKHNASQLWDDDYIQFVRLLAEIYATQDCLDIPALCESMDLEAEHIDELFKRADQAWERIKQEIKDRKD